MIPGNSKTLLLLLSIVLITILAGCSPALPDARVNLENLGPAPELTNEVWINTDQPLRLADLRGNVVLLEMWTYG